VAALRNFWETVTAPAHGFSTLLSAMLGAMGLQGDFARGLLNQAHAFATLMDGATGFFTPRPVPPFFSSAGSIEAESFYEVSPLRATLERLVDFDRINAGTMRFSVGAVNVRTGNFEYFDTTTHTIGAEHIMASGSLPPGFPATRIDGEYYWDGGLIFNTPLQ
jgi:NTE family protein